MKIKKYTLQELKNAKGILLYGAGAWGKLVLETLQTDVLNGGGGQKYRCSNTIYR